MVQIQLRILYQFVVFLIQLRYFLNYINCSICKQFYQSLNMLLNIEYFSNIFYQYMVSGIIDSNIVEDGGEECYREIPLNYHTAFVVILSAIHILFLYKWKHTLYYNVKQQQSSIFQKIFALLSLASYAWTFYFKVQTKKGLFMLNPCHITILIQIYLMISKNTPLNTAIHTAWTGWLFGPYMATLIPHLNGVSSFEVFLYYYQHLAIVPFGYLILNKRYGFLRPNFFNQLAAFSTIGLYQLLILAPLSRQNMVNLNFALCHSPADPLFKVIGFYYFVVCTFFLNIFSFAARWVSYLQIILVYKILSFFGVKSPFITQYQSIQSQTPLQFTNK